MNREYLCFRFIPQWREKEWERAREGEGNKSGEMFPRRAMILQADSHDVSLVKKIIGFNLHNVPITVDTTSQF